MYDEYSSSLVTTVWKPIVSTKMDRNFIDDRNRCDVFSGDNGKCKWFSTVHWTSTGLPESMTSKSVLFVNGKS